MRTFIGPDIILLDLTEGPTLFAQSAYTTTLSKKRSHRITVKSGFHNRLYHQIKMFHKDLKTRLSDYINHVKV